MTPEDLPGLSALSVMFLVVSCHSQRAQAAGVGVSQSQSIHGSGQFYFPVCPSVYFICLSVHSFIHLRVHLSTCLLFICPSLHPSICVHPSTHLSVQPSVSHLSVHPPELLSIFLFPISFYKRFAENTHHNKNKETHTQD